MNLTHYELLSNLFMASLCGNNKVKILKYALNNVISIYYNLIIHMEETVKSIELILPFIGSNKRLEHKTKIELYSFFEQLKTYESLNQLHKEIDNVSIVLNRATQNNKTKRLLRLRTTLLVKKIKCTYSVQKEHFTIP